MPNLITPSFFIGDINIPNTDTPEVSERLAHFIAKYEAECLAKLLGYELYKAFIEDPDSDRMKELLNGAEYVDQYGKTRLWRGLVHSADMFETESSVKNISLIAYYVYYAWQESLATQSTGITTAVPDTEAGKSVSPYWKMISAWNSFAEEGRQCLSFLWRTQTTYPEFNDCHYEDGTKLTRKINSFGL